VGMLVDNAIVVVENIARLREEGIDAVEAAIKGTTEVAVAITASTLTTIAVFLPLTFVEGLAGRLFRDQSLAVVCSLLASLVVALTVVPLIASRDRHIDNAGSVARGRGALRSQYERLLAWSMARRGTVMGSSAFMLVAATLVVLNITREVVPRSEQGRAEVAFVMPPASDLPLVDDQASAIEHRLREGGMAAHVLVDVGERDEARLDPRPPYEGELIVILPDGIRTEDVAQAIAGSMTASDVQVDVRPVRTQLEMLISPDEADLYIDLVADDRLAAEAAAQPNSAS